MAAQTAQPAGPRRVYAVGVFSLYRVFMVVACILFVIAALIAGQVFSTSASYIPWTLGGFAAVALAWAVA